MSEKIDMKISGASSMPGGEYGSVSISGSGKIRGNVKCDSLRCSGSAKVEGDAVIREMHCSGSVKIEGSVDCSEEMSVSGAFRCDCDVHAKELRCSGGVKLDGQLTCGSLRVSGGLDAGQDIHCQSLKVSGSCSVEGGVEGESVILSGRTKIQGLLNADTIEISADGVSEIGDIGCTMLTVRQQQVSGWSKVFGFQRRLCGLKTNTIEGDTITVEYTQAKVVRGRQIVVGPGCKIDRVEYTVSCEAEEGTVQEKVKV